MTSVVSNEELKNIRLDSEEGLIYHGFLELLEEKGIITVGDLFEKVNKCLKKGGYCKSPNLQK